MSHRKLHGESMMTEAGRAEWGARNARASALAFSPYKRDFPLLASNLDLAFLDSAATAQAIYNMRMLILLHLLQRCRYYLISLQSKQAILYSYCAKDYCLFANNL